MTPPNTLDADELSSFFADIGHLLAEASGPAAETAGRQVCERGDRHPRVWSVERSLIGDVLMDYDKVHSLDYANALRADALTSQINGLTTYPACPYNARLRHRTALSARRLELLLEYSNALQAAARRRHHRRQRVRRYGISGMIAVCLWWLFVSDGLASTTTLGGFSLATWATLITLIPAAIFGLAAAIRTWGQGTEMTVDLWTDVLLDTAWGSPDALGRQDTISPAGVSRP